MSLSLTLKVWRQKGPKTPGAFETYQARDINEDMSFLEMLDVVNEELIATDREPIAFDHDCREGICGTCGVVINGRPHGPNGLTTTCQLHMRFFNDGDTITVEPWRAASFPIVRDLVVNRSAFDSIIQAGGYITAPTGESDAHPEGRVRHRHGRSRMHRLWGLCGCLPERRRTAVHLCQARPPQFASAGPARTMGSHNSDGRHDGGVLRQLHELR